MVSITVKFGINFYFIFKAKKHYYKRIYLSLILNKL